MSSRESQQIINFDQLDEASPILIHSRNVVIQPSSRTLEDDSKASNKITTTNVVDYSWEDRYTLGHLISYHPHTSLIAYVLSISNNYMIRILNEEHSARCLIKDFTGEITDIAFSKSHIPYLASIDINGSVKVNKVNISSEVIECLLILNIKSIPSIESVKSMKVSYSRVMWCWHNDTDQRGVDESDAVGTNISLLLGVVHGSTFEVLQIDTIENELAAQSEGSQYEPRIDRSGLRAISQSFQEQFFESESLSDLFLPYLVYTAPGEDSKITSLAISSDAAAFAVALRDGTVRFFTLDGSAPSGLKEAYSWRPFNGEAVWSLLFLDDCRAGSNIDSFWCHVVVGGAFNRELKLFRCDKWDCIQTVSFQSSVTPCLLSAHIDQSARYLIMSDIRRKALYVLELDSIDNNKTKLFKNVQEFVLTQSLLSFDINTITSSDIPEGGNQIVMKMFTITKGAFQKMRVSYASRGHRLNEILVDINDENIDQGTRNVDLEHLPVSTSLLTHVSSLPSANSSFQDPAIISTQMLSNSIDMQTMPTDIPPSLQHLFSGAVDRKRINDSGDESGDEASLNELIMQRKKSEEIEDEEDNIKSHLKQQHQQIPIISGGNTKFPSNEECGGFPLPPNTADSRWDNATNVPLLLPSSAGVMKEETEEEDRDHNNEEEEEEYVRSSGKDSMTTTTLGRLETYLRMQHTQLEKLTNAVQELQKDRLIMQQSNNKKNGSTDDRCMCKEARHQWSEQTTHQLVSTCQKSISEQLEHIRLPEMVERVSSRLVSEMSGRLDETVRMKLGAVESASRDFLNSLLHDKKFIGFIANMVADCLDKPLRAAYFDMCRKELVPALGKTLDRLFADTREVLREGIKEALTSVDDANKVSMRTIEDRLGTLQKTFNADLNSKLMQLINEANSNRSLMTEGFNKQRNELLQLNETVRTMKESFQDSINHQIKSTNHIGQSNSMMNINAPDPNVLRQQKVEMHINKREYAAALTEALAMTDMRILLKTCSRINTKTVLSCNSLKVSQLQSSSILALIQQLSRDFDDHFETKFEYLFDAILSLDTNESGIKSHCGKVLKGVVRRLETHQEKEKNPVLKDKMIMLLRIVTSRLDSSSQE